ncbi:MAG: AAA family ATPase [Elusimicrobia bacterium]|nr:AAA family ATPase [Elusimicrobiota bacterium]
MWIEEIQVRNYRSIRDSTKLKLTKLFALIGKNNSGKSALIEAIQAFWNEDKDKKVKVSDFHKATDENIGITVTLADFKSSDVGKKLAGPNGALTIECKWSKDLKPEKTRQPRVRNRS